MGEPRQPRFYASLFPCGAAACVAQLLRQPLLADVIQLDAEPKQLGVVARRSVYDRRGNDRRSCRKGCS
jgi:hypothetical protein